MCTTGSRLFVFRVCAGDFPSRCLPSETQENLQHDSFSANAAAYCTMRPAKSRLQPFFSASFLLFIKRERLNETHG